MKNVFYLGPEGTFSHNVAKIVFKKDTDCQLIAKDTLSDVAAALKSEHDFGILPIENSISSNVHQSVDLMLNYKLKIIKEAFLSINFDLIGLKDSSIEQIKTVIAHPMAFMQCNKLLQEINPVTQNANSNISAQFELLKQNSPETAAISTKNLVDTDKLKVFKKSIVDFKKNNTRFVIVQNIKNVKKNQGNKVSLLFKTPHKPGSLAEILQAFAENSLNLTKIESRPIPGTNWEYLFWVDILIGNNTLEFLEGSIAGMTSYLECIGMYDEGEVLNDV